MLEGGRIRYEGTAKELTEQPELLRSAYLLRGKAAAPALDAALDATVDTVRGSAGLTTAPAPRGP